MMAEQVVEERVTDDDIEVKVMIQRDSTWSCLKKMTNSLRGKKVQALI